MIEFIKKIILKIVSKYNQFFFVGSTDILPPPLEKEEEVELSINPNEYENLMFIINNVLHLNTNDSEESLFLFECPKKSVRMVSGFSVS